MATTKLLRMKQTSKKNKSVHLKNSIFYICNPDKTDGGLYVGGNAGMQPKTIYQAMQRNKERWNKETGSQGFHYMLSFPPGCGVDEKLAYQIGEEFCQELLGDDFLYVIAVHNDKPHMHVHIVFDSVSRVDGHKFHSPKGDWEKRIQPISDRLCEKYHLPTLDYDPDGDRKGKNYGDWKREKKSEAGMDGCYPEDEEKQMIYNWRDIIRDDIDEAISAASTYEEFLQYLQRDYEIRDKKYLSLRPLTQEAKEALKLPGNGAVRTGRLGSGYGKEEIQARIKMNIFKPEIEKQYKTYGNRIQIREVIRLKVTRPGGWKMSPLQKQFYRRWAFTCFIRRPGYPKNWKYKKDIIEVQKLSDGIKYMLDQDIDTSEALNKRKQFLQEEANVLKVNINMLGTQLHRPETEEIRKAKEQELALYKDALRENIKEQEQINDIFRLYYEMETEVMENKEKESRDQESPKTQDSEKQHSREWRAR